MVNVPAKIISEELKALHLTEEEMASDEGRHLVNIVLSKVATAILNAETRMLNEDTKRIKGENENLQLKFLDHAVGSH